MLLPSPLAGRRVSRVSGVVMAEVVLLLLEASNQRVAASKPTVVQGESEWLQKTKSRSAKRGLGLSLEGRDV